METWPPLSTTISSIARYILWVVYGAIIFARLFRIIGLPPVQTRLLSWFLSMRASGAVTILISLIGLPGRWPLMAIDALVVGYEQLEFRRTFRQRID